MKTRIVVFLGLLLCCYINVVAQTEYVSSSNLLSDHPRVLLQKGEEKKLKKTIMKLPKKEKPFQVLERAQALEMAKVPLEAQEEVLVEEIMQLVE